MAFKAKPPMYAVRMKGSDDITACVTREVVEQLKAEGVKFEYHGLSEPGYEIYRVYKRINGG